MPAPPVIRGTLGEGGPIALLRELEQRRVTGVLRFRGSEGFEGEGAITLFGGAIALEQAPRDDGRDPLDVFLALSDARYEVHQQLPPLAVSRGDDFEKRGSLAVHVPADLMSYCEHAGLTGTLELSHDGRRLEAIYDAGELVAIELDGRGDADLSEVFAWAQGRFRITLCLAAVGRAEDDAPTEKRALPRKREDTHQFLRVVEMALVDVIEESERARSPTRTSPPLPEPPKARPRTFAAPKRREAQTVRLVYLSGDAPSLDEDTSTRHVQRGPLSEPALTEAQPERRATPSSPPEPNDMAIDDDELNEEPLPEAGARTDEPTDEPEPPAPAEPGARPGRPATQPANPLAALLWAAAFLALGIVILVLLARLPPLQ